MVKKQFKNKRFIITIFGSLLIAIVSLILSEAIVMPVITAIAGICGAYIGGDSYRPSEYKDEKVEEILDV